MASTGPVSSAQRRAPAALLLALAALVCFGRVAYAGDLEEIRQRGRLSWGADQEGGGPYVYPREDDPRQVTGFEVELAELFAAALGVKAELAQGNWDKLPDLLRTGKIDVVLNGYEWSAERARTMAASMPYYVYGLQLLVRKGDASIASWDDLGQPSARGDKRRVGVLTGSAAEEHVRRALGDRVTLVSYDGNTDAMREVETEKLDATLQDTPIASFYAPRFPGLRPVGAPVGKGYYVVYARAGELGLVQALDQATVELLASGKLEALYRKYGLWDEAQSELFAIARMARFFGVPAAALLGDGAPPGPAPEGPGPPGDTGTTASAASSAASAAGASEPAASSVVRLGERKRGWEVVRTYAGILVESAGLTVVLSLLSFPLAIALGLAIAVGRLYGPRLLRAPLGAYVELLRGTPLMLQLYFIFFFLPELGVRLPAFATAILGLAVNYSAYESEIYRAGLQAVPPGQMEAALALGMTRGQALRRVVVPQAARIVIPPVVNDFIALFKDTSVCSVITLVELTKRYSVLSMSTQATIELMLMTAVLYLGMSYPLAVVSRRLEKRLGQRALVT
ncbi:MAG: ABC transporter permease subunit [Polyangiaceae bacterium]|nr:ABC transporter permease subunit [Polyangiaceae bacterium]